jgi:probable H4MPT-linked C1 transfer pathway protein
MSWLAIDIGGANLKAADGRGWACSRPLALWREPDRLRAALAELVDAAPAAERIAITMTGELCDCFCTKADGVRQIVAAAQQAAGSRDVLFYLVDGRFVGAKQASELPHLAAASNWHALARFACRYVRHGAAVLIDIGSTTTDIVPLRDGHPCPLGWNDTDRLVAGELVYTGVGRTPVCAITRWLPWRDKQVPVAAELFATMADAYVLLDCLSERSDATWTADGRPLSKENAQARLARMICADTTVFSEADAVQAAAFVHSRQISQLRWALRHVMASRGLRANHFVISGSGEFLAASLVHDVAVSASIERLSDRLGDPLSASATAHALAVLADEMP